MLCIEIEEWFHESQAKIKAEIQLEYTVIPERRAVPREASPPWTPPKQPIIQIEETQEQLFNGKPQPTISKARNFFDF